ncbi:LmeA family phospholipid-binding protein [Microbacterium sp.]|uniref:LmeA family phospholipid-binding protein n=1 Tax=Microbacterium sp. TaxID=51671 RepID=UPI003A845872
MTGDGQHDRADAGNSRPDAFPTVPLPAPGEPTSGTAGSPAEVRTPRRRRWPWLVAAGAAAVLLVAGILIAEQLARSATVSTIRSAIIAQVGLPADQQLDVQVGGFVLPQLIGGTLDDVHISADEVTFGDLTADIQVRATGSRSAAMLPSSPLARASNSIRNNSGCCWRTWMASRWTP